MSRQNKMRNKRLAQSVIVDGKVVGKYHGPRTPWGQPGTRNLKVTAAEPVQNKRSKWKHKKQEQRRAYVDRHD